jgi:hypothetical protein
MTLPDGLDKPCAVQIPAIQLEHDNTASRQGRTKRTMALEAVIRSGRMQARRANGMEQLEPTRLAILLKGPYATH